MSLEKKEQSQYKEKANIIKDSACNKCKEVNNLILYSCSHEICVNCIYNLYMSNNFKGLTTTSVKIICPICQNGEEEINLDDWLDLLKQLLVQKNRKNEQYNDDRDDVNNDNNKNYDKYCKIHKDKMVLKYCKDCKTDLCEKCLREIHERYYKDHYLIDIERKKEKISENKYDDIKNNKYINGLQEKETIFMQKLESESIMIQTKINQIIKDLNNFLDSFVNKIIHFQNNMKKIFQIINLSYYNYYLSIEKDKKEITFSKELNDFNIISKKLDMNDLIYSTKKLLSNLEEEKQLYNFELKFDSDSYKKKFTLKPPEDPECITKILELKPVNKLVSSSINGKIYIWDLYSKNFESSIEAHSSAIWCMIKLFNDNIVTGSSDRLIKVFDLVNQHSEPLVKLRGHRGTVFCIGELENNKILSGSEDRTIRLWDLTTKKCILNLKDPNESKINCLYILKDYRFVLTGGDDNLIKIWNVYSEYIPNCLKGHECTIWSLTSISDDDTIIASGSSDNTIKIWDLIKLKCLFSLEGHENTISSLKLLNNSLLASSSWDQTTKIWNIRTKACVFTLKGHKNIVWDVIQLGTDDLATCSSDMSIIIWSKK